MGQRKPEPGGGTAQPPSWAMPVHYATTTLCGNGRRGHRLTHDPAAVTCRFCATALRQEAMKKKRPP